MTILIQGDREGFIIPDSKDGYNWPLGYVTSRTFGYFKASWFRSSVYGLI